MTKGMVIDIQSNPMTLPLPMTKLNNDVSEVKNFRSVMDHALV